MFGQGSTDQGKAASSPLRTKAALLQPAVPATVSALQRRWHADTDLTTLQAVALSANKAPNPIQRAEAEKKKAPVQMAEAEKKKEPVQRAEAEKKKAPVQTAEAEKKKEPVQRAEAEKKKAPVQMAEAEKKKEPIQRVVAPEKKEAVQQRKPNATGMSDQLKAGVEQLSGMGMDDVRVHYQSAQPAQVQAHAFAQGRDIHLAPGQERHLPHEAWHVVQQKQGRVQPTTQLKGKIPVNDDPALEKEADVMGARAMQLQLKADQISTPRPLSGGSAILQGAFINAANDPGKYPHLHTEKQYMGYTYTKGNHVQLRSTGGAVAKNWFQSVGIALESTYRNGLAEDQRAHHQAILDWIAHNDEEVWASRR